MKLLNRACSIALSLFAAVQLACGQAADWRRIQAPSLHEFHPQIPKRVELGNGLVIMLQEDHELPLVRGTAQVRGGSREEPANQVGLVDMYGEVWRTGGTKSKTGDQLDDFLEAHAAKVETWRDLDSTGVNFDCLKENFDEVFKVFLEVLREPEFREDKLTLARNQLDTSISRRNDNPMAIAYREAAKLVYGPDSPYARVPEYATAAAATRDDLLAWHRKWVFPHNIILGVSGDFDAPTMEAKLREALDSWTKGTAASHPNEQTGRGPKPGLYYVPKEDVTASTVQMVDLGTRRDNPDYYAIEVFNQFFGGSFSSRLFSNIRSKKGLAYSVGGGIGTAFDHPGILRLFMGTKSATTAAAIDAFNEELNALQTNPATADELAKAKEAILNSFIFRFDSKEKVLRERMAYEFYGYPADFLERYRAGIEKVTQADVARVAQKYVHKDRLAVLVVGKAADFDRPLSTFGPVTTLDITIPEVGPKAGATGSNPDGKALLTKVIEGLGGEAKVRSVRAWRKKGTLLAKTPQGEVSLEVEELAFPPDRVWQKMTTPMGEMTIVLAPGAAFMASAMGTQDLPSSQKAEQLKELKREPLFVAQHADDPKFSFSAAGTEKVSDIEANILDVTADGTEVRWFIDPQTGHILRSKAHSLGMSGAPGEQVADYSDWKAVEGVSFPFKASVTHQGQGGTIEMKEIQVNPPVDEKLFQKPAAKPAEK